MEELTVKLNNVKDSYYSFIVAVLTYVKKDPLRFEIVNEFIEKNPAALSSDILEFISEQDDFYNDAVPACEQIS